MAFAVDRGLAEQFAVRTKPGETKDVSIGPAVDQQVGLDVTFAVASPIPYQSVVAMTLWQVSIGRYH